MSSSALALAPAAPSPKHAYRWGYCAAHKAMPQDWHLEAVEYAWSLARRYPDPVFRERLAAVAYAVRWALYIRVLRARHWNWALEVHGGDEGRAQQLLHRYPATERSYYRARAHVLNLVRLASEALVQRFEQLKCEPIGPYLVDSSFAPQPCPASGSPSGRLPDTAPDAAPDAAPDPAVPTPKSAPFCPYLIDS